MRKNADNFVKIVQLSPPPDGQIFRRRRRRSKIAGAKFKILTVLVAVFPHFCPNKREYWHESCDPLSRAKFHVYRNNLSLFRGEKPIFAPLCECNTGKKENKFEVYPKSLKELVETDVSTVVFVKFIEELIDFGWR